MDGLLWGHELLREDEDIESPDDMRTCPKCGRKIEYLLCYTAEYNTYYFDGKDLTIHERHVADMELSVRSAKK